MTERDRCQLVTAMVLAEVAKAMLETNAAGPCGYWNREVATKLNDRAIEITANQVKGVANG